MDAGSGDIEAQDLLAEVNARARELADSQSTQRLELVCCSCGYSVSVERQPERCPMCSASDWRRAKQPATY